MKLSFSIGCGRAVAVRDRSTDPGRKSRVARFQPRCAHALVKSMQSIPSSRAGLLGPAAIIYKADVDPQGPPPPKLMDAMHKLGGGRRSAVLTR
jgi:hypothetical protein